MAHTEHVPIYKESYALCLYLEQVVRQFSRYHKYTLGSDLIVPTLLRVGMPFCNALRDVTQSVTGWVPTRSVGTIRIGIFPDSAALHPGDT